MSVYLYIQIQYKMWEYDLLEHRYPCENLLWDKKLEKNIYSSAQNKVVNISQYRILQYLCETCPNRTKCN